METDNQNEDCARPAGSEGCAHGWITPPECPQCIEVDRDELEIRVKHLEALIRSVVKNVPIVVPSWSNTFLYKRCAEFIGHSPNDEVCHPPEGERGSI
jgi:hypothetical protein